MNRWLIFAAFMFIAGNLVAGVVDTQAVVATTQLDGGISASATTITVKSTTNFHDPTASSPAYSYIVVGNEFVRYTSKDATHFYVPDTNGRGVADPRTGDQVDAKAWPDKTKVMSPTARTIFGLGVLNIAVGGASFGTIASYILTLGPLKDLYKMLTWDYPWFTGTWILARILLFPFSIGIIWGLALVMLNLAQGLFKV
jgi:hypothetical protein